MLDGIQPRKNYEYYRPRLPEKPPEKIKTKRRRVWPYILVLLLAVGVFTVGARVVSLTEKVFDSKTGPIASLGKLFLGGDKQLEGEEAGEIRVLLMGIGGEGHDGPLLTDTMLIATIRLPKNSGDGIKIGLVSIPRDLNVQFDGQDFRRINSAYAFGGAERSLDAVEKIIGEDIPYYAVIDFAGFEKVINDLGGVTVNVEQGFTDRQFPDEKQGFLAPVVFEPGEQKMDGRRALQFVRSRHGDNGQSSDFARSRRQQLVLESVWDKSNDFRVVANIGLLNRMLGSLADNFRTNLEPYEIKRLYSLAKGMKKENIVSVSIDEQSGLVCPQIIPENGAYVLLPCAGLTKYDAIRDVYKNQFLTGGLIAEHPVIEIQNATEIAALGKRTQDFLMLTGVQMHIGNFRGAAVYNETVIYDNTKNAKPETLGYLKDKLGARVAGGIFPFPTENKNPDFVIVVAGDIESKLSK